MHITIESGRKKMIRSKATLKEYYRAEKPLYINGGIMTTIKLWLLQDSNYLLWHYVKMLRKTEYYYNTGNKLLYWLYQRKKNIEGARLGISIFHNCIGKGLQIYHYGSIIVNSHSQIGENLKLHGNNCIGNKGEHDKDNAPVLRDNIEMGIGSQILGNITIESNVTIAANAAVVKSCNEENVVLAGVPARKIMNRG